MFGLDNQPKKSVSQAILIRLIETVECVLEVGVEVGADKNKVCVCVGDCVSMMELRSRGCARLFVRVA